MKKIIIIVIYVALLLISFGLLLAFIYNKIFITNNHDILNHFLLVINNM